MKKSKTGSRGRRSFKVEQPVVVRDNDVFRGYRGNVQVIKKYSVKVWLTHDRLGRKLKEGLFYWYDPICLVASKTE
jgi:hypothetical protein